jgi:hypothetical protein
VQDLQEPPPTPGARRPAGVARGGGLARRLELAVHHTICACVRTLLLLQLLLLELHWGAGAGVVCHK